jgi:hypothetical protein
VRYKIFMTKKNWLSLFIVLALATVYAVYFTSWFTPQTIQVFHAVREVRGRHKAGEEAPALIFGFNKNFQLTEIKVVPLAEFEKNPDALPVWHLISNSNSVPIRDFVYGRNIRGMKPAIAGSSAQPLETNIIYRLLVTAGKIKGQHDFQLGGAPAPNTTAANP